MFLQKVEDNATSNSGAAGSSSAISCRWTAAADDKNGLEFDAIKAEIAFEFVAILAQGRLKRCPRLIGLPVAPS